MIMYAMKEHVVFILPAPISRKVHTLDSQLLQSAMNGLMPHPWLPCFLPYNSRMPADIWLTYGSNFFGSDGLLMRQPASDALNEPHNIAIASLLKPGLEDKHNGVMSELCT
jgi:hypothetical protein